MIKNSSKKKKFSVEDLVECFKKSGLLEGDTVLVHSDMSRLIRSLDITTYNEAPEVMFDSFMEALGASGTLIVPTFNFDFCKGASFDVRHTRSKMGIFTEYVRSLPQSKRILHPIYSFSVVGKLVNELGGLRYKSSFGNDSLFAKLKELCGKIMIINLPYGKSLTFAHHVEEMEGCDYRYFKEFKRKVTDHEGKTFEDTFIMLVRDLDKGVITRHGLLGKILEEKGLVNIQRLGNSTFKLMRANCVYRITAQKMKENRYLLHQIKSI